MVLFVMVRKRRKGRRRRPAGLAARCGLPLVHILLCTLWLVSSSGLVIGDGILAWWGFSAVPGFAGVASGIGGVILALIGIVVMIGAPGRIERFTGYAVAGGGDGVTGDGGGSC